MGEALIVRKGGGGAEKTITPTINFVSKTPTSIVVTVTNNSIDTAIILCELGDDTPDQNTVQLNAGATSPNITFTGLTADTAYIIYATANALFEANKIKSEVATLQVQTDPDVIVATGGAITTAEINGINYKIHTFTSSGTFSVTQIPQDTNKRLLEFVIVGGGGGAGASNSTSYYGGGGGGGGYRSSVVGELSGRNTSPLARFSAAIANYSIVVGSGGARGEVDSGNQGSDGGSSSALFNSATGGGGGGSLNNTSGRSGGSGGGAQGFGSGGSGATAQGFNGGTSSVSDWRWGAPGGGAGGDGQNAFTANQIPPGGAGITSNITGTSLTYALGGHGNTYNQFFGSSGTAAGRGFGGGSAYSGFNGGRGIVIIRYVNQ